MSQALIDIVSRIREKQTKARLSAISNEKAIKERNLENFNKGLKLAEEKAAEWIEISLDTGKSFHYRQVAKEANLAYPAEKGILAYFIDNAEELYANGIQVIKCTTGDPDCVVCLDFELVR